MCKLDFSPSDLEDRFQFHTLFSNNEHSKGYQYP
jgi:hypothetical protein